MKPGYEPWIDAPWEPRRWQREAFYRVRRMLGERPLVRAVTGAGKSIFLAELACALIGGQKPMGAFPDPVIATDKPIGKVVVTTPTVALVDQLAGTLRARGLKVGKYYTKAKQYAPRIVVCCNDSFPALIQHLEREENGWAWIADEAHRTQTETMIDAIDLLPPRVRVGVTATPYRSNEAERLTLFDTLAYNYGPADAIADGVVVPIALRNDGWRKGEELNDVCIRHIKEARGPGVVDAVNITDAEEFAELLREQGVRAKAVHSKLKDRTVRHRVELLERGELDVIVHVSMLSEGVDMPWLRWLVCRRPIGSRVRFAQYVGRGIRCLDERKHAHHIEQYGPKNDCTVYDVHNLFQVLDLDYEAILGVGAADEEPDAVLEVDYVVDELVEEMKNSDNPQETLAGKLIRVLNPAITYLIRMRLKWMQLGIIRPRSMDGQWRRSQVLRSQVKEVRRLEGWGRHITVPHEHRKAFAAACAVIADATRGAANDLIVLLSAIGANLGWPKRADEDEDESQ